ncbi:MAG: hypothetical protein ACXV5Q_10345 [Frankiaceae bacterium]
MPRHLTIDRLEEHPNLPAILGVLAQLPHISDADLPKLAAALRNTVSVAEARRRALTPDSPLVIEVLAAFDAISALFADDIAGDSDYVKIDPAVTIVALKAVRDAVAATYARPSLSRGEYGALMGAWRAVYPRPSIVEPELGPAGPDIKRLLGALPQLARRCHDPKGREAFEGLVVAALTLDEDEHNDAVDAAFRAAVRTGRRRIWALVRRSAAEGLGRFCQTCRVHGLPSDGLYDDERVLGLCADAACALLVSDAVDPSTSAKLTAPVSRLIPLQRRPVE